MSIFARPDRAVFKMSGEDAEHLLHDVLTTTVVAEPGPARWFALLSPQGKLLAEGLIGWHEEAFWLDVHRSVADNFFKRMKMYRLRAKMDITPMDAEMAVGWAGEAPAGGIVHEDGRLSGLGYRVLGPKTAPREWTDGPAPAKARIARGIAELGPDFPPDDMFPHDIGMDHLGGVDFKKGCFVGQEVVSRMQHRGTARRRPVIVSGCGPAIQGDTIMMGGKSAGVVGEAVDGEAVGIVRLDRITDPAAARVNGATVQLALPSWARYAFADSATPAETGQT